MKHTKKLFALLLALVLALSCCVVAFAGDEETPAQETPSEPVYVARMYICARVVFFGHVWLYFENLTDGDITVGVYTVPAGEGVSVGAMGNSRADGYGIYYNVEAYMIHKMGGSGTVGRSMLLTQDQLNTVNATILERNEWSLSSNNCCRFATRVWNSVADRPVSYAFLPLTVKGRIGSGGAPNMFYPPKSRVYRQHGTGTGATLSRVKGASLIMFVG